MHSSISTCSDVFNSYHKVLSKLRKELVDLHDSTQDHRVNEAIIQVSRLIENIIYIKTNICPEIPERYRAIEESTASESKLRKAIYMLEELFRKREKVSKDEVLTELTRILGDEKKAKRLIRRLIREGELYEPEEGFLAKI